MPIDSKFGYDETIVQQVIQTSTTPAGSTGELQFNNANVMASDAKLVWDAAASKLTVTGPAEVTSTLAVGGTLWLETTINKVSSTGATVKVMDGNTGDATDFTFYGEFDDGGTTKWAGISRDATDDKFHFFSGTQTEPTTIVDHTATGYGKGGAVVANIDFTSATMRGHILPDTDDVYDIGSASNKIRDMYVSESTIHMGDEATIKSEGTAIVVQDLKTSDLHLDNTQREGNNVDGTNGSWTFQEGADNLFLLNNITGKKYKINLTEI